jgi:hypothetical protein
MKVHNGIVGTLSLVDVLAVVQTSVDAGAMQVQNTPCCATYVIVMHTDNQKVALCLGFA